MFVRKRMENFLTGSPLDPGSIQEFKKCRRCGRDISNRKYRLVRSSLRGAPPDDLSSYRPESFSVCEECYDIFKYEFLNYYSSKKTLNEMRSEAGLDPIEPMHSSEIREKEGEA